tara:strand:+ start:1819 stop:4134 length:2316 start_codon:yes stop_codon:yes gene_type:complete
MEIIVNKKSLVQAIIESLSDNQDGPEFERDIFLSDEPIKPVEMMATQLVEDMPPVDDPEFLPVSIEELGRSAYVISKEVPNSEINFFYRKLHELLDTALDREEEKNMAVESLRVAVRSILGESRDHYLKNAADRVMQGEDANSVAQDLIDSHPEFESDDSFSLGQEIENLSYASMGFSMPAEQESEDVPSAAIDDEPEVESEDDEDDEEGEVASDVPPSYYGDVALGRIIKILLHKNKHLVPLKNEQGQIETTPTLKRDYAGNLTLSNEPMYVLASQGAIAQILDESLQEEDIKDAFDNFVRKEGNEKSARTRLEDDFIRYLGEVGDPVTPEIAAIMSANNMADNVSKDLAIPKYGQEISGEMIKQADELESSQAVNFEASSGAGKEAIVRTVPIAVMIAAIRQVSEERKEKPKRAKRKTYEMEYIPTPEELAGIESAKELEQIKKNMKNLTKNAPLFNYSAASGLRQWINKFPLMAYTALMSEEKGHQAFQGYQELLMGYMVTLLDNFIDIVIPAINDGIDKSLQDDSMSEEEREEMGLIVGMIDLLSEEFEEMRQSALTSDNEEIDVDLLLGDGSYDSVGNLVLRNAVNILFKEDDLMNVAKYIEDKMTSYFKEQGLPPKAATKIAHMFNGRVTMVDYKLLEKAEEGKAVPKSVENVYKLGIGTSHISDAQKKIVTILSSWFNEDEARKRSKIEAAAQAQGEKVTRHVRDKLKDEVRKKLVRITDDEEKEKERKKILADILDDAIGQTVEDLELDINLDKMMLPASERG